MNGRHRWRTSLIAMWVVAAPVLTAQETQIGLPLGAKPDAPTIEDLDGRPVSLTRYVGGKPLVVEFWATWCPVCEELLPRMADAHRRYGERAEFLAIAVAVNQTQRGIRRHLERHPLPFPVLWDAGGRAVRAFMAPTTSYVVVLDREGRVVYTGTGEDQDIAAAVERAVLGPAP